MPTYESVAAAVKKEIAQRTRARQGHRAPEQDGRRAQRRRQRRRGRAEARADRGHDRGGRPLRPHAGRPAGRQHSARARRGLAGLQQRCRRRQRCRSSSTAAMSGTTCSASRRRANARSTRSAPRSRRNGARTRSRAGCGPRRPKWCKSSSKAATSPSRPQRSARRSKPQRLQTRRLACRRALGRDHGGVPHRQGRRRPDRRAAGGSEWIVFRVTDVDGAAGRHGLGEVKKLKETLERGLTDEQVAQYVTKIEADDRHDNQPGRIRAGDGR